MLTKTMMTKAVRAIESVHAIYYDPDGIKDLETRLEERRGVAARHIYGLALLAAETDDAPGTFLDLCAHAETEYKRAHSVENLAEALPTWRVFKSGLLTGMRDYDMDPRKHRTEGAFRVARAALVAENRSPRGAPAPLETPEAVDHMLATTVTHDALRTMVSQVVWMLESLKRGTVKDAQTVLRAAMDGLAPLVDERKAA